MIETRECKGLDCKNTAPKHSDYCRKCQRELGLKADGAESGHYCKIKYCSRLALIDEEYCIKHKDLAEEVHGEQRALMYICRLIADTVGMNKEMDVIRAYLDADQSQGYSEAEKLVLEERIEQLLTEYCVFMYDKEHVYYGALEGKDNDK